jgi:hypothetical protein
MTLLVAIFAATGSAAPVPAERLKAEKELAVVATKLHGTWLGEPCEGDITFHANRTYEWTGIGPGGERHAGAWTLIGDPAKPTLVMKCMKSDDPDRTGKTTELKFARLDEASFAFELPDEEKPHRWAKMESPTP